MCVRNARSTKQGAIIISVVVYGGMAVLSTTCVSAMSKLWVNWTKIME